MISLVITNYKTWDLTERCIRSVEGLNFNKTVNEIIVVDDYSNESIPLYIQKNQLTKVISNESNRGYATSVNIGFGAASNEIVLLLDSDAYFIANLENIVYRFNEDKNMGLLGFKLVDEKNEPTGRGDMEPSVWSLILGQKIDGLRKKTIRNTTIESLYSCAIAVRKQAFIEVGGFDTDFDFLDADNDFSMKINRSKWSIDIDNEVLIFHKGGGSPQLTSTRVIRYYRNRLKLLKKYHLYQYPFLFNQIIKLRLYIELFFLKTKALFARENPIIKDKIYGRKQVITLFK